MPARACLVVCCGRDSPPSSLEPCQPRTVAANVSPVPSNSKSRPDGFVSPLWHHLLSTVCSHLLSTVCSHLLPTPLAAGWPLWSQFAPEELRYKCKRTWTTDPAYRDQANLRAYHEKPVVLRTPLACWTTCWTPITDTGSDQPHCTAACPAKTPLPLEWRVGWDRELAQFKMQTSAGREYAALAAPFAHQAQGTWHSQYLRRQIFRVF